MIEPTNFTDPEFKSDSENYDLLLEKGISLVQNYSGENWTDYNYHDPGVTLLEQLCYALTDLGYRTNFPIEDLLIGKKEDLDLEKTNLLFPIDKILPSSPLTERDYQKMIIENLEEIKNAWVQPVNDNFLGLNGLYNVFVQCDDSVNIEIEREKIYKKVFSLLMENRSLGTDFQKLQILQKDVISIDARIKIDSFVLGETILSEIFFQIEKVLNPKIKFQDIELLRKKGVVIDDIYSGPAPSKGYINPKDFTLKTSEIYISEIKEIIERIDGVIEVEELFMFKNGIKIFEDLITFGEDNYPFLNKNISNYSSASEQIKLYRDNNLYQVDTVILSQLYDSLSIADRKNHYKKVKQHKINLRGRFNKKDINEYFSIQNEFPSVYGLKENELPSKSNKKRLAQVKQLRGFLTLFEQLMANHLSQLANFHNFFSIDKEINKTLYVQYAKNIPGLKDLLNFNNEEEYTDYLGLISESKNKFFKRRIKIINHLLSRFSEHFDTETLEKLMKIQFESITDSEVKIKVLDSKINYAENLIENGKNRGVGFNYIKDTWDTLNSSGLEKRIKLLIGNKNLNFRSLITPLVEDYNKIDETEKWNLETLKIKGAKTLKVLRNKKNKNSLKELNYYSSTNEDFKFLFSNATKSKNYNIVTSTFRNKKFFHLLFSTPGFSNPIEIFRTDKEDECLNAKSKGIDRFENLNSLCEGFFMIEHILLRPLLSTDYSVSFFDDNKKLFLKSFESGKFEEQNDIRNDIFILGAKKENYSVIKTEGKKEYQIILFDIFNKPIFKSPKQFYSKSIANGEMKKILNFFIKKSDEQKPIEEISEILIDSGTSHEFPSDFPYSNQLSFIFPDWPLRFQNTEFKTYLSSIINEYVPAQFEYEIYFLNINQLTVFEDTYFNWLDKKKNSEYEHLDSFALQLIQLLKSYKSI